MVKLLALIMLIMLSNSMKSQRIEGLVIGVDVTVNGYKTEIVRDAIEGYINSNVDIDKIHFIKVVLIHARTLIHPIVIADYEKPKKEGIKGKYIKAALLDFYGQIKQNLTENLFPNVLLSESHIDEFFKLAEILFNQYATQEKMRGMLLISDMLQVDLNNNVNWEKGQIDTTYIEIPRIGGQLTVIGAQSMKYSSYQFWMQVKEIWHELFSLADIKVLAYSPMLDH